MPCDGVEISASDHGDWLLGPDHPMTPKATVFMAC